MALLVIPGNIKATIWTFVNNAFQIILFILLSQFAYAAPTTLEYQGRILKSDGTALEYGNVSFLFQITDPSGSCILYQEQRSGYSMVNSGGVFDVPIGSGTVLYPLSGGTSILDAFDNTKPLYCGSCASSGNSYSCTATTSQYSPVVSDGRLLRVSFYDGSGWKLISPDNVIRSVPYAGFATTAQKLGTNVASDFLLKAGLPTCGSGTFLAWDGSSLSCAGVVGASGGTVTDVLSGNSYLSVVNGTTTPTLTVNVGTVANTVAAGNDSRIVNAIQSGAAAAGDLSGTLPSPTVAKIQGVSVSATAPTSNQFLKYNGSAWAPVALATSDVAGLDTALSGKISASQISGSCAANQTLVFLSPSSAWTCTNISISDSQITYTSQAANKFLASPTSGSGAPTFRAMTSSDLPSGTLSGAGTAGYVPYYNTSSSLANSSVYYDGANVGVGTASPSSKLHIVDEGTGIVQFDNYSSAASTNPALIGRKAGGTVASPTAVLNTTTLFFLGARGYYGGGFSTGSRASILMASSEDWSSTNQGTRMSFYTTTNGATTAAERMRIDNNGYVGIGATTPTSALEVRGGNGLTISSSSSAVGLSFKPEDQAASFTNTADQRQLVFGTTGISASTDFGYKLSWRNADGTPRQDSVVFTKDGSVNFVKRISVGTYTPRVSIDVASTDAIGLPVGTTAQRPSALVGVGMIRWNSDTTSAEIYNGSSWVSLGTYSGAGAYTGVSTITGSSSGLSVSAGGTNQNLTLSASGTGTVTTGSVMTVTNSTASTAYNNGALVVSGGVGVNGNINSSGNVAANGAVSGSALYAPFIYGGTTASQNITIDSTSNTTKGKVLIAPSGGNVGIANSNPGSLLTLNSNDTNGTSSYSIIAQTGTASTVYVNGLANISSTATTANSVYGALDYVTFAPAATSSAESSARQSEILIPNTNSNVLSNYLYGAQAKAINMGSGNVTGGLQALYSYASNVGTGTVSNVMGVSANAGNFSTGTVTNLYGARITGNNLTGGTVTNSFGIYVGGFGSGGGTYTNTPYDIYTADTGASNVFMGKVGVGTAAPANKLDVSGGMVVGSGYAALQTAPTNGIASQGSIYINQTAPYTTSSMTTPLFQLSNIGDANSGQSTFASSAAGFQSRILLNRSRGTTVGDYTTVQSGDSLGSIHFAGADGTGFITSSQIMGQVDGTISTGVVPGRIMFLTANSSGSNAERMRIDSKGNVGIGTTSPSAELHVYSSSNTYTQPGLRIQQAGSFTANNPMNDYLSTIQSYGNRSSLGNGTQHGLYVQAGWNNDTNSTEIARFSALNGSFADVPRMVVQSSGNVGIGTTAPVTKLSIVPAVYTTAVDGIEFMSSDNSINSIIQPIKVSNGAMNLFLAANTYANTAGTSTPLFSTAAGGAAINIRSDSGAIQFLTGATGIAPTVNMFLNSSGYLGIGTSGPTALLHVNGAALASAWNLSSDIRLKEHVLEIENPLDKILNLRAVEFDWRKDIAQPTKHEQTHDIGVIAQEVEKQFPEAVTTNPDGFKSVAYSKLVSPLIGAVKALYARIIILESQRAEQSTQQVEQARKISSIENSKADKVEIEKLKKENAALKSYLCSKDPAASICH